MPAFDGLVRAAAAIRPVNPAWAAALLAEATLPAAMAGRVHLVRQVAQQVGGALGRHRCPAAGAGASLTVLAMVAEAFVMAGELDRAARYRLRAETLLPSADLAAEQQGAAFLAQGDIWTERYEQGRLCLGAVVDRGRRMGAPATLSLALGLSERAGLVDRAVGVRLRGRDRGAAVGRGDEPGRPDRVRPVAAVPDRGRPR